MMWLNLLAILAVYVVIIGGIRVIVGIMRGRIP